MTKFEDTNMNKMEQEISDCFQRELHIEIVDVNESLFKSYRIHPRDALHILYKMILSLNIAVSCIPYWNADTTSVKTLADYLERMKELNCDNNG